jgi:hypothetical protein
MSLSDWHSVELTVRGAHAAPSIYILGHLVEEDEPRPFQGLRDLDRVDEVVEWCTQVHDSTVRGVLLLRQKAFKRQARGAWWVGDTSQTYL